MHLSASTRLTHRILRRAGLFQNINRTVPAELAGQSVRIPIVSGLFAYASEPWMLELLRRLLTIAPGAFVDVGVNLGQTLAKVKVLDPARRYIGFEPNPACVHYVDELLAANGWRDCLVVPAGLGTATGVATLELYHGRVADSAASLVHGFRPGEEVTFRKSVVVLDVDSLPADLLAGPVGVVKIDVEGAEADVVMALAAVIDRDRPFISMEILPCYNAERTDRIARQHQIERQMSEADYGIFRVIYDRAAFTLEALDTIEIHGDMTKCEYVMAPREKAELLIRGRE